MIWTLNDAKQMKRWVTALAGVQRTHNREGERLKRLLRQVLDALAATPHPRLHPMNPPARSLKDLRNTQLSLDPAVVDRGQPGRRACPTDTSPEAGGEQTCEEPGGHQGRGETGPLFWKEVYGACRLLLCHFYNHGWS